MPQLIFFKISPATFVCDSHFDKTVDLLSNFKIIQYILYCTFKIKNFLKKYKMQEMTFGQPSTTEATSQTQTQHTLNLKSGCS